MGTTDVVFPAGGGTTTGRRTYTLNQTPVALRTSTTSGATSLAWLAADDQASTDISINATDQAVTRTRYTPYGKIRATTSGLGSLGTGLPTDKSYLGKTFDSSTGLSELGARYYQAGSGIFTAPDPLIDPTHPRTTSPYTYSAGNPITYTDPTGLCIPWEGTSPSPGGLYCGGTPPPGGALPQPSWTPPLGCSWCDPNKPPVLPSGHGGGQKPGPPPPPLLVVAPHQGCGGFLSCMGPVGVLLAGIVCIPGAAECLAAGAAGAAGAADFAAGGSLGSTAVATAGIGARLLLSQAGAKTAAATAEAASVALPEALSGGSADTYVYLGIRNGKPVYTGITNNLARRGAQHGARFDQLDQITDVAVTRGQARSIEQALIARNPGFENKINSISPTHAYYQQAVDWGNAWLKANGL